MRENTQEPAEMCDLVGVFLPFKKNEISYRPIVAVVLAHTTAL
jgi:hypothetical protein